MSARSSPDPIRLYRLLAGPALALTLCVALAACDSVTPSPDALTASARPDAGFTVVTMDASGRTTTGRQEKLDVCHYDKEADAFKLISVGAPALLAHLRQGSGVPGGEVPGRPGYTFDEACAQVPISPFTCTVTPGLDAQGRNTLTVALRVVDPAFLPVGSGGASTLFNGSSNAGLFGVQAIMENGQRIGYSGSAFQASPTAVSVLTVFASGQNIPGGFRCGPYEFGAPTGA